MSNDANYLDVRLLEREYRVACPPDERGALLTAVDYVDAKMREISGKTKAQTAERVAVMVALNIAHELLSAQDGRGFDSIEAKRRISSMEAQLDDLLKPQEPLF